MRGTIEPVGKGKGQGRGGFDATVAAGLERGEDERLAQVHRQVAEQMARAAVMMVGIFVAMMAARGTGMVVGVGISVLRRDVMPVRGLPGRRLPGEGRRQQRRQQDEDQEASDGSRGAVHA